MKIEVTALDIYNEMDVVLSHRRAMQIAKFAGISLPEQTRFATAVSEICRNVLEYVGSGAIVFNVQQDETNHVEAIITDKGKGIAALDKILQRDPMQYKGRGLGIVYARRLCDRFDIRTSAKGTAVTMQKNLPPRDSLLSKVVIEGWKKHMQSEPSLSAYEELKVRNLQLLQLTDELKQQKEQLDQQYAEIDLLNRRLQQHNANMKDFTFSVSHDLRTPLTSLGLSLSMIEPDEIPDSVRSNFEIAARAAKRLDSIIKGLLDILEIQNPARHVIKNLDMEFMVRNVLDDFANTLEPGTYEFHLKIAPEQSLQYVEGFMQSILTNLVSNSIKYRRPETLALHIETEALPEGLRLVYRDNGQGIDLENSMRKIFSPFTRFTTEGEGKGIGLYLVKTMVESNGGSINVHSVVGKGTTFVVDFIHYRKGG